VVCGFTAGGQQSTGALNDVVSFLSILSSIGASVGELALNGASPFFGCGCTFFPLAVSEALDYLVASRVGEQLEYQSLSKEHSLQCIWIKTVSLAGYLGAYGKYWKCGSLNRQSTRILDTCLRRGRRRILQNLSRRIQNAPGVIPVTGYVEGSTLEDG
jgi:hypothetical protein